MNIKLLSLKIFEKIGKEANLSNFFIHFYLESQVHKLNELLNTNFHIKSEFSDEIANIFEKLFDIYFYENGQNLNKNMIIEDKDKESLKKINRNAVSKTFLIACEQEKRELKLLINNYKIKQ